MLERLLQALEMLGLPSHGKGKLINEKTGIDPASISRVFNGVQKLSKPFLKSVCRAYAINEEWVKTGEGSMFVESEHSKFNFELDKDMFMAVMQKMVDSRRKPSININLPDGPIAPLPPLRQIPIISMAQAGDNGFWEDAYERGDGMEFVDYPPNIIDPKAIGFRIEGDSMWPTFKHGDKVIIDTTKEVVNNDEVVVMLKDGRVMAKVYKRTNGFISLESYNSREQGPIIVSPNEILRMYKIVCTLK